MHHLHSGSPLFHLSGGHIFETHLPLGSFIYTAAGHWSSFAGGPRQYWPCFRWDAMRWRLRRMRWRRRRWQPGISSLSSFSSLSFTSRISLSTTLRQLLPAVMRCYPFGTRRSFVTPRCSGWTSRAKWTLLSPASHHIAHTRKSAQSRNQAPDRATRQVRRLASAGFLLRLGTLACC